MIDCNQLSPAAARRGPASGWPFPSESPWTLQRLSRAYAEWVLAQTGGDKQRAAEILGRRPVDALPLAAQATRLIPVSSLPYP